MADENIREMIGGLSDRELKVFAEMANRKRDENKQQGVAAKKKLNKIPTPFSMKQLNHLFWAIDNVKIALVCLLALRTGMRINEVLGTKIVEIEWELKRIYKPVTKGGKPRVYYLDDYILAILKKWIYLLGDTEYLFPSNKIIRNDRMHNNGFYNEYKKYLKEADLWVMDEKRGVKRHIYNFHTLRTTFCSLLVNKGVPPLVAMELMGHSKIATTLQHYTFLGSPTLINELDKVFGQNVNKQVKKWEKEKAENKKEIIGDFNTAFENKEIKSFPERDPLQELQIMLVRGQISIDEFNQKSQAILSVKKSMGK